MQMCRYANHKTLRRGQQGEKHQPDRRAAVKISSSLALPAYQITQCEGYKNWHLPQRLVVCQSRGAV